MSTTTTNPGNIPGTASPGSASPIPFPTPIPGTGAIIPREPQCLYDETHEPRYHYGQKIGPGFFVNTDPSGDRIFCAHVDGQGLDKASLIKRVSAAATVADANADRNARIQRSRTRAESVRRDEGQRALKRIQDEQDAKDQKAADVESEQAFTASLKDLTPEQRTVAVENHKLELQSRKDAEAVLAKAEQQVEADEEAKFQASLEGLTASERKAAKDQRDASLTARAKAERQEDPSKPPKAKAAGTAADRKAAWDQKKADAKAVKDQKAADAKAEKDRLAAEKKANG